MCRLKTSENKRTLRHTVTQKPDGLEAFLPTELQDLPNPQTALPAIAKNARLIAKIEDAIRQVPTQHHLLMQDARQLDLHGPETVHLVLTSPPYWTLKKYRESDGQLGSVVNYDQFLTDLDRV